MAREPTSRPREKWSRPSAGREGAHINVQEIIEKFDFRNQLKKLDEADVLGHLIEKFIDPNINLSPNPVFDGQGNIRLPGLDNHGMGYVFEELIRRFNEENNEEAGEHFTPREVVRLMANLIFLPIKDEIESGTYLVYDGACGTGGMLTISEEILMFLVSMLGKMKHTSALGSRIAEVHNGSSLFTGDAGQGESNIRR